MTRGAYAPLVISNGGKCGGGDFQGMGLDMVVCVIRSSLVVSEDSLILSGARPVAWEQRPR